MDAALGVPGEREPPLYFAGRENELDALGSKLRRLCSTGDPSGGLQLTVGVPGVGKTQLAVEFAKRVTGSRVAGREVAVVDASPEELDSPVDLFKTMGCALDIACHTPDLPGLLRESMRARMWDGKALVLMVDEIQGTSQDGMKALRVLHNGKHGCPILLLGFGLQHTESRLANQPGGGISRLAAQSTLSSLADDDTLDAFERNLSALGHDDVPEASLQALAEASFGFPQYINGYLAGAHEALARHDRLAGAALDEALEHGRRRRVAYYDSRLARGKSRKPMRALASAMTSAGTTELDYDEALAALESAGFDRTSLDRAIEHGALVHDNRDRVSFGIPSFHRYMATMD